jgi:hypothetical protein
MARLARLATVIGLDDFPAQGVIEAQISWHERCAAAAN